MRHAAQESSKDGIYFVDKQEQFCVLDYKLDDNGYGSGRCFCHQATEPSNIAEHSPTQAMPGPDLTESNSNGYLEQPQLVEVRTQLNKISPPGSECLPPSEGRLMPPDISLGQHFGPPGEGQPLPSKDALRDLQ